MRTEQERSNSQLSDFTRPLAAVGAVAAGGVMAEAPVIAATQSVPQAEHRTDNTLQDPAAPQAIYSRITEYNCIPEGFCGETASGNIVEDGWTAACGADFDMYDIIDIEGVGERECLDTGYLAAAQVDVFYEYESDSYGQPDYGLVTVVGYDSAMASAIQNRGMRSIWSVAITPVNLPQDVWTAEKKAQV